MPPFRIAEQLELKTVELLLFSKLQNQFFCNQSKLSVYATCVFQSLEISRIECASREKGPKQE